MAAKSSVVENLTKAIGGGYTFRLTEGPSSAEMQQVFNAAANQEIVRRSLEANQDGSARIRIVFIASFAGCDYELEVVVGRVTVHPSKVGACMLDGYVERAVSRSVKRNRTILGANIDSMCGVIALGFWVPLESRLGLLSGGVLSVIMKPA